MSPKVAQLIKDLRVPIIIALVCCLITYLGQPVTELLRYDAQALKQQEVWRLITPHFVHLGWSHLAMNMAGLFLVFLFFARCLDWRYWLATFVASCFGISVLIYFLNPEIQWYVGMSGVLHALFMAGGLADIKVRKWEGILFTALITGKLIYEQLLGPLPGSEQAAGGPVLVDAHFYGALIGVLIGLVYLFRNESGKA